MNLWLVLNYGDTENVLINHLLLVIPMSYLCHYTNLCPHKPHKHAHTHTHTHTHTYIFTHTIHVSSLLKVNTIVAVKHILFTLIFTLIIINVNSIL